MLGPRTGTGIEHQKQIRLGGSEPGLRTGTGSKFGLCMTKNEISKSSRCTKVADEDSAACPDSRKIMIPRSISDDNNLQKTKLKTDDMLEINLHSYTIMIFLYEKIDIAIVKHTQFCFRAFDLIVST